MSENKITIGLVAPLLVPMSDEQREGLWSKLDSLNLDVNYEGTLIFSKEKDVESYDFDICVGNPANPDDFTELCQKEGFPILSHDVQPYFAHWYNGSDSPMSTMTLEQFKHE